MKIGIIGAAGRMGRMLIGEVLATEGAELSGGTEASGSPFIGTDLGLLADAPETGVLVTDDTAGVISNADAVIDFTAPVVTAANAQTAAHNDTAIIIGTTGFSADQLTALRQLGSAGVIVHAANFSVGVNLLLGLTQQAAAILGDDYDIEIVEMHHRHKVDAPSGTALALGEAAAAGREVDLEQVSTRVRDGITGPRPAGDIGFATLRGGSVVGEHTVMFAADGERFELTHKAADRGVFAQGAVRAAIWAGSRSPGYYSMRDVLGFK
jgi:4-hydroxy-tetrahydrodipicolinate reductase